MVVGLQAQQIRAHPVSLACPEAHSLRRTVSGQPLVGSALDKVWQFSERVDTAGPKIKPSSQNSFGE